MLARGGASTLEVFDLGAHRTSYVRYHTRGRVRVVVRNADSDAAVRVSVWLGEVEVSEEGMVRLVSEDPAWNSQLAALQPALEQEVPALPEAPAGW